MGSCFFYAEWGSFLFMELKRKAFSDYFEKAFTCSILTCIIWLTHFNSLHRINLQQGSRITS